MVDKETVVAALKCFVYGDDRGAGTIEECRAKNCPYAGTDCEIGIMEDALKLLEPEQKEKYVLWSDAKKCFCETVCRSEGCPDGDCDELEKFKVIPAAEVEPIVYGEWEERVVEEVDGWSRKRYYCSACGDWQIYGKTPRCPYCGAHMKVEDE